MAWKLRKDKLKSDESEAQDPVSTVAETAQTPVDTVDASFERLGTPLGYDLSANVSHPTEPAQVPEPQFVEEALPQFSGEDLPHFVEETPSFHSSPESIVTPVEDEPVAFEEVGEKEPISLGAFAPYQPPSTSNPTLDLEPLPEFDSILAPSAPALEPDEIEIKPLAFVHDTESAEPAESENEAIEPVLPPAEEPAASPVEAATVPDEEPLPPVEEPIDFEEEPARFDEEPLTFAEEDVPAVAPFDVSPEREAVAPGLVSTESETGMPRVAPFILDAPDVAAPVESDRMHHIVLRLGNLSASYILVKDVTTIGRPDSAVQNYPDIEVELDDGVSRRHAEIRRQNERFFVVDTDSTNGTILNGEMLTPEQPVPLHSGDRIRIGERTEMLFE